MSRQYLARAATSLRVIIVARGVTRLMRSRLKPKSFLDDSRRDWQFDAYAWLLRNTGGCAKFHDTELILPTGEFFPDRGLKGRTGVAALFRRVRDHAGMADWPCTIEPEEAESRDADAAGGSGRIRVIRYRRGELDSGALVAHFALELARYLITAIDEPVPGGEAMREPAAEIAANFIGFGLFIANAAAQYRIFQLNEGELAHALAMFCLLRRSPPESAALYLNPHLRKHLRLAARDLAQHELKFQKLRTALVDGAERTLPTRAL
jgi:hypothetical protein